MSDAGLCLKEKGKARLRAVQAARPTAERGGIGHAVRIFERRRGLFPGVVLHKAPPQSLTARQQAVMRVRERKKREKGEGLPASVAAAATDGNPVMMLIVCLLATASMADDRIAFTSGASAQDDFGATRGPIGFEQLVRRHRKWDKQNRTSSGLCPPALTSQDLSRKQSSFHLTKEIQLEENTLLGYGFLGV